MSIFATGAFVAIVVACKLFVLDRLEGLAPELAGRHNGHWD